MPNRNRSDKTATIRAVRRFKRFQTVAALSAATEPETRAAKKFQAA